MQTSSKVVKVYSCKWGFDIVCHYLKSTVILVISSYSSASQV